MALLMAATACGSDRRSTGTSTAAGEGGAEASGSAGVGGAAAGEATSGAAAGGEMGGAAAGSETGGAAGAPTVIDFTEHRLYQHLAEPFQTFEQCLAAQDPDFFINCYQEVDFCPDGSVVLILTDVQEQGSYVAGDGVIDASWKDAFDAPENLRFSIVSARHLVDDIESWDWLLAEDSSLKYCP